MYKANFDNTRRKVLVQDLIEKELIVEVMKVNSHYELTEKGHESLILVRQLEEKLGREIGEMEEDE